MRYTVIEAFATPLHRFHAGMEIDDVEIDGPLSALDWVELGKLDSPGQDDRAALQAEAAGLGLEIDRRWGAARLREEIEAHKADLHAATIEAAATAEPAHPGE